ncbi:MAG: V-type ATP synthase subunit D [Alkalispirochaetaceae bacterium]
MATVKLTKNELKRQKDMLKRFKRYLPTLQLKKQQLQMVIRQVEQEEKRMVKERDELRKGLERWIAVFGEDVDVASLVEITDLETDVGNIAGIDIPVFRSLTFAPVSYNLFDTPLWVDEGVKTLKELLKREAQLRVLQRQRELLAEELRITTQRVNLFEKVKIPETQENIRRIRIYLGDQETAAVVRGKIAKNKVVGASA